MTRPPKLCFVLMPFGVKELDATRTVHFDAVYDEVIKPAVEGAGLRPIRADEEQLGGIIHKPMFERLFLCDYAIADLTAANANVFYELGVRHALRRVRTTIISAQGAKLPFDLGPSRVMHRYGLDEGGRPSTGSGDVEALVAVLEEQRVRATTDSPVYQLLPSLVEPTPDITGVEAFEDQAAEVTTRQAALRRSAREGVDSLDRFRDELGTIDDSESGLAVGLLLAYMDEEAWARAIAFFESLPPRLSRVPQLREQYAMALNREGRRQDAQDVLEALIDEHGPSGEACGILGRVHKDQWEAAKEAGDEALAAAHLDRAITSYRRGFQVDWRDHYPGVNLAVLLTIRDPADPELDEVLPVVRYGALRSADRQPGYWAYATLMELAVLGRDAERAREWLGRALATTPSRMATGTTARTLRMVRRRLASSGEDTHWLEDLEERLTVVRTPRGDRSP